MALYRQWEKAEQIVLSRAIAGGLDALGYASVKPEQLEAIKSLLRGEDVFVSAPTGFGLDECTLVGVVLTAVGVVLTADDGSFCIITFFASS